jgi:hypothetical protein
MSDLPRRVHTGQLWTCVFALVWWGRLCCAQEPVAEADSGRPFESQIQPLLARYCHECHSATHAEGEIDLSGFKTPAHLQQQIGVWQKVRQMLDGDQMPPPEAPQPTDAERKQLRDWVRNFLAGVARQRAGDPGPVMLRRLTNAEYNYTIRDLTGVDSLDPTREFPVDGAAGEGFTNVGEGQGMSPALVRKYLDAAKQISEHLVLLPEGVRFSAQTSQRDQTDELLGQIQAFYRRYTADGGGTTVNLDGNPFTTNQGGRLPLEAYLQATLAEREALIEGTITLDAVAAGRGLSAKYLRTLWNALTETQAPGPLLDQVRRHWQAAGVDDVPQLAELIAQWQAALWKFHSIGHIGREGSPTAWMEAVSPITSSHEIRFSLPDLPDDDDVTLVLAAADFGIESGPGRVIWRQPRLEFPADESGRTHPPVPLRDIRQLASRVQQTLARELPRTADYLVALSELHPAGSSVQQIAEQRELDSALLARWAAVTGIATPTTREITGHFDQKLTRVQGYEAINGWGGPDLPSLLTNRSDEPVQFLTLTVPARGVTVHPSPTLDATIVWKSPVDARLDIRGLVADADDKCGNGVAWQLELHAMSGSRVLLSDAFDDGGSNDWQLDAPLEVATGDLVTLAVSPRAGNHACDTTHVNLKLSQRGGQQQEWDLATDIVDDVLRGNPHPDSYGHPAVWHFCGRQGAAGQSNPLIEGSSLAQWREALEEAQPPDALARSARAVERTLTAPVDTLSDPDRQLNRKLLDWTGPLGWLALARNADTEESSPYGLDPDQFGRAADAEGVEETDLCLQTPHTITVRLPSRLARGAQLTATGVLHPSATREGCVQLQVLTSASERPAPSPAVPVLAQEGTPAHERVSRALDQFRQLFPPALCYARIVPVDEVVTLTLYHREDHHLARLMLDEAEAAELDRLWDELGFVSQEPLKLVVAFEQISEFATQDRPDLVEAFAPLRQPILDRAEAFAQQMLAAEPSHVEGVIEFAGRAWRRPLSSSQQQDLRDTYESMRADEIDHAQAVELLLARVLTAPAFLYKMEQPALGEKPSPVSDWELAARLSYFLWASLPDDELRQAADTGRLSDEEVLLQQTRRMLRDPRTRRLAIHFACQWLHVRDFDQHVEKNEQLYPEFAGLREAMYEETVRFFEDLFRNDGSILAVLDADHTFLNAPLARHYGLEGADGEGWQRVKGVRSQGRGGILGMATVLASQSGASRTSPILRGTWVSETLLGERLPRPPAGVPTLPDAVPENLTARQLIELHSSAPGCATCHRKIDPYGFALEQFDTLGRSRSEAADTRTTLIDGKQIEGLTGLRDYLLTDRREDFVRQFCRKLLGFALGREVQLSDEPLLEEISDKLKANEFRFSIAVEAIVTSRQFRDIRGQDQPDSEDSP